MTVTQAVPVDEITAEAREIQLSRVLLFLFLGFFWVIGWTAGKVWLGLVIAAISARRGWRDGTGAAPKMTVPHPLQQQQ